MFKISVVLEIHIVGQIFCYITVHRLNTFIWNFFPVKLKLNNNKRRIEIKGTICQSDGAECKIGRDANVDQIHAW